MIVRFGIDELILGKIYSDSEGALAYIGSREKLEGLAREAAAGAADGTPATVMLAWLLERYGAKQRGRVWAESVEAGPNAVRHPMTEYLILTGSLHPDYYDDYFC